MLKILKTNQLPANLVFVIYILILRLPYLILHDCQQEINQYGVLNMLYDGLFENKYTILAIQTILLVVQAAIINTLIIRYRMMRDPNLYPGLMWVLINTLFPEYFCKFPFILANLFLLLAVVELFKTYKKNNAAMEIFNTGFYIAIAALFKPGFIIFLLVFMMGIQILRAVKFKEYLLMLSGFFTVVILVFTYFYWNDSLSELYARQIEIFDLNNSFVSIKNGSYKLTFMILLIVIALFYYAKIIFKQSIQNIKYIEILYLLLACGIIINIVVIEHKIDNFLCIALPLSIFGGLILNIISSRRAEIVHLLFIFFIYFWQFGPELKNISL